MKYVYLAVLAVLTIPIMSDSMAEEYTVLIPPKATSNEICAADDTCIIPSTLYINVGDDVHFDAHIDNGMMAFCYGTRETGCNGEGAPPISKGNVGSQTFSEKGIFDYFDTVHPWMHGRIVVGLDEPPEQNKQEIQAEQEKNIEDYNTMTELKMSERMQLRIDELEQKIDELNQQIRSLEFEVLQLQTKNDHLQTQLEQTHSESMKTSDKSNIAPFVDKNKDPQYYVDKYNNEPKYKEWFDQNYPEYNSIEQAVGLELVKDVPEWVQNTALWFGEGKISEEEFLNAMEFLINQGIINIIP